MYHRKYQSYHPELTSLARINRHNATEAEKRVWLYILNRKQTRYKFLRQKPIGPYIVDFYSAALQLVIEIDGESHAQVSQRHYDKNRTEFLKTRGIKVLRYYNIEVLQQLEGVYEDIEEQLAVRKRELEVGEKSRTH